MPAVDKIVDQFVARLASERALAIQHIDAAPWFETAFEVTYV